VDEVKLVYSINEPEKLLLYMARVSNTKNQDSGNTKLIKYLIDNKHWSPFDMIPFGFEIVTCRAIQEQIIRHWSLRFQIFSQRYAKVEGYHVYPARMQDPVSRQSSLTCDNPEILEWFDQAQREVNTLAQKKYAEALKLGIAKDHARFLLTMGSHSKIYAAGSLRSWIHFLDVRDHEHAQWQTQEIARGIKTILMDFVPHTAQALGWMSVNDE